MCVFLQAQSPLEEAVTLAREKRYTEANSALSGVPEPAQLSQRIAYHRLKAAVASGLGDTAAAAAEMESALALSPSDAPLLQATALAELQAGKLDDAVRHTRAAGKTPQQEGLRIALSLQLVKRQEYTAAIDFLKQSAADFPRSAKLYTLLGIAQYARGESADAILCLERAIAIDPTFVDSYRCLSKVVLQSSAAPSPKTVSLLCSWNATACSALRLRTAREQGDATATAKAIAELERVPASDPTAVCELGRAYEWTDRLAEARGKMETCRDLDPSAQNHYRLSLLYKKLGLNELAGRELEARRKSLEEMPGGGAIGVDDLGSLTSGRITPSPH